MVTTMPSKISIDSSIPPTAGRLFATARIVSSEVTVPETISASAFNSLASGIFFAARRITPNDDDKNTYFKATSGCPAHLQVFSRWGTKVFEAASYHNDWDGGTLPSGTYYYLLQPTTGPAVKGWLEISR